MPIVPFRPGPFGLNILFPPRVLFSWLALCWTVLKKLMLLFSIRLVMSPCPLMNVLFFRRMKFTLSLIKMPSRSTVSHHPVIENCRMTISWAGDTCPIWGSNLRDCSSTILWSKLFLTIPRWCFGWLRNHRWLPCGLYKVGPEEIFVRYVLNVSLLPKQNI